MSIFFLYFESRKRELKIRCIYECRCDERLHTKTKEFTPLTYTGLVVGLEHLKIETRLIVWEVCECDGWVCDLEVIGVPFRFRATLARIDETRDFNIEEKIMWWKWKNTPIFDYASWTPEIVKKRSVSRWVCNTCKNKILINSLWSLPDILTIAGMHKKWS